MNKRRYTKPQIRKVKLAIEEAVLAVCKTSSGGDTKNTACSTSGTGGCCKNTNGS